MQVAVSMAGIALMIAASKYPRRRGAYLSDELPYSRDRYCCYRAHRDFICDAFQMAYRLIVDRGTPARPLDREGRVLLATRRKDCLPIELSIQMPDRHDRCGPTRGPNEIHSASPRLATYPPFADILDRDCAVFSGNYDLCDV